MQTLGITECMATSIPERFLSLYTQTSIPERFPSLTISHKDVAIVDCAINPGGDLWRCFTLLMLMLMLMLSSLPRSKSKSINARPRLVAMIRKPSPRQTTLNYRASLNPTTPCPPSHHSQHRSLLLPQHPSSSQPYFSAALPSRLSSAPLHAS